MAAFALMAVLSIPGIGNADLIEITATGGPFGVWVSTDFTIVFDDTSGDGLLQLSELISFSGTTLTGPSAFVFDAILAVPDLLGISTQDGGVIIGTAGENWTFNDTTFGAIGVSPVFWLDYTSRILSVPEPTTLALFCAGLLGFTFRRKRA